MVLNLSAIKHNYANALFEIIVEKDMLDKVWRDFELLKNFCDDYPDWVGIISAPIFNFDDVVILINHLAECLKLDEISTNFLLTLHKNKRFEFLIEIIEDFFLKIEQYKQIKLLKVTTNRILSCEEKTDLTKNLVEVFCQKVKVDFLVDHHLISGLTLEIDNKLYDASLKNVFDRTINYTNNQIATF